MAPYRRLSFLASVLAVAVAARPAVAQQQPWAPAPPAVAQQPPPESGGVGLQILASVGIGAAAVGTIFLVDPDSPVGKYLSYGLIATLPAGVGMAVCSLKQPTERREPSCPRAVIAAYIGSLLAVPVALIAFVTQIDWGTGPNPHEERAKIIIASATSVAWIGGMTLGATVFGSRRVRRPAYAPPPPWPAGLGPVDDPHQLRWAGARSSGQLVFRLVSLEF